MRKLLFVLAVVVVVVSCLTISIDGAQPETCKLAHATGPCRAAIPRFYFNPATSKCEPFLYGGCQGKNFTIVLYSGQDGAYVFDVGNDNRFNTEAECLVHCNSTR